MPDVETEPRGDPRSTSTAPDPKPWWARLVRWSAWIAVAAYCGFLLHRAQFRHRLTFDESGLRLADLMRIRQWAVDLVVMNVNTGICFGLLGFLVALALAERERSSRWFFRLDRAMLWAAPYAGLLFLLAVLETGGLPTPAFVAVSLIGYLFGSWIGRTVWRGPWALARLVPLLFLLLLVPAAAAAAVGFLAMEDKPFTFEPLRATAAEKRRLADKIAGRDETDDKVRRLRLSEEDVNLMLAMGIAQVHPAAKGRVELGQGEVVAEFSLPVGTWGGTDIYVNARVTCEVTMAQGGPVVHLTGCRVGRLAIPAFVLRLGTDQVQTIVNNDPDLKRIASAVESLSVQPGSVEAVLVSQGLMSNVVPSLLARLGRNPDVAATTRVYYRHLVREAKSVPKGKRFERLTTAAFRLAKERSVQGDPTLENRAAVLALAMILGHRRVEHLVGPVTDSDLRMEARRHAQGVMLRGRSDWCKHFFVSAALALVSNQTLTDQAGLFKEEADSAEGGSGFSFSDLLADRAGARFALAATRDEESARMLQKRLADGFRIGEIFPQAADLPEGIPEARLQSEYGGVQGEKYKALVAEIERRLDECEGLK